MHGTNKRTKMETTLLSMNGRKRPFSLCMEGNDPSFHAWKETTPLSKVIITVTHFQLVPCEILLAPICGLRILKLCHQFTCGWHKYKYAWEIRQQKLELV